MIVDIFNRAHTRVGRVALLLLVFLQCCAGQAFASCPPVLSEAPPFGDPPNTAQVMVVRDEACPLIAKVSAGLYADDKSIANRTYYADTIDQPPLRFPVTETLTLPNVAGLYRIEWLAEFENGEQQSFVQTFAVPCPPPGTVEAVWSDADSTLLFDAPAGDACEGTTTATLALRDAAGQEVVPSPSVRYNTDAGTPATVTFPVERLEGERRFVGELNLQNQTGQTTVVPVEFVTGCGPLKPKATIIGDRMVGSVQASECQYPIEIRLSAVHESGEEVSAVEAILMDDSFDFSLPEFRSWPAGEYSVEMQFIGSASRARLSNPVSIACSDPSFTRPSLEVDASGNQAEVVFELRDRDICQKSVKVTAQVRDANRVIVFNRSLDLQPSDTAETFRWPFRGLPGNSYDLELLANYGLNQQSSINRSAEATYECTAPEILELGYANADATHVAALVALTACNAPATAKLVVRNAAGRVVVDADPQLVQDVGTAFARIAPISLGHLDSGQYEATLTVADNRARIAEQKADLVRDVDAPKIQFSIHGKEIGAGETVKLNAIDELSLLFSDANDPMGMFQPYEERPRALGSAARAELFRIDGESTPQMWFTGMLETDRSWGEWGFVGLVARGADGTQWLAPVSRTFVPMERNELAGFHPARHRIGFRAVARVQNLSTGRFDVVGMVIAAADGAHRLVPATGTFNVSALSTQQHDAILRQGVSEIPIALAWSGDRTARLERVTSVPDGDYTLSAISRDVFGNPSEVHSLVFRLDQEKQRATLKWPAITGYNRSFQHRFREEGATSNGPLRVLYRRVSGYGNIRVNGREVTEQTSEDMLEPDANGVFAVNVELLDAEVDARFVLHGDSTDAVPLELSLQTYRPEFVTQRTRTENTDTLSIRYSDQPCRNVVFDDLSRVSLRADEVLCAVRLNIPGTSVVSTTATRSEVRLPQGVSTSALYEEGFIRVANGVPTFQPTRQVPIRDMQAYSSTPQVEFVPLPQYRTRASDGHFVTSKGAATAGHFVVRAGLGRPVVYFGGEQVDLPEQATGQIRLPYRTHTTKLGDVHTVTVKAHYPDTPDLNITRTYEFVSVPDPLFLEAQGGQFVTPGKLSLSLQLRDGDGPYDPSRHGAHEIAEAMVVSRDDPDKQFPVPGVELRPDGLIDATLGALPAGAYRLQLSLYNADPRFSEHLKAIRTDTVFEVFDGNEIEAGVFTFRKTDKVPFFGQLSVDYQVERRRTDVSEVAWEVSDDGKTFQRLHCCGQTVDFALTEPSSRFYRAKLTNRHSSVESFTDPIKINAYLSGDLSVNGPRNTFRGFPAEYTVANLPEGYEVLWRVTSPNAEAAVEHRSATLTIPAEETGVYVVEVIADTANDDPDAVSALRTFFTLNCTWPRIPESVISGPTKVEYGKVSTFTVTHPDIFKDRGNPAVKRVGEWELPDGTRVDDDEWAQFTLRELPEGYTAADVLYHTWIEGDQTTLTTAVHRIEPVSYRWPNWRLKVATNSVKAPAVLRLSVVPDEWRDWMGLGASPITTHWELPDFIRVLERTPTEAIVYAVDDRQFDVVARITDPRGNVTEIEQPGVRPLKQIPFEISLRAVAERTLHTAPIEFTAIVDPIVLPKGKEITRVAFYVDGLYRGVSDGSPMELQIRSAGQHRLRAIASIDNEFTADDEISLEIGENHQATCTIAPVGDFRLNGLAKAQCSDPDGHMVEYRWYANGQLLSDSGTRVQLSRADRMGLTELSLVAVDNAGIETTARYLPPAEN